MQVYGLMINLEYFLVKLKNETPPFKRGISEAEAIVDTVYQIGHFCQSKICELKRLNLCL